MKFIYPHIFKTGGTSFTTMLLNHFLPEEALRVENEPWSAFINKSFYHGHMPYGLHKILEGHTTYIGLVRDPIERVVSSYYFMKAQPYHPMFKICNTYTLEQVVEGAYRGTLHPYIDDIMAEHQTRILAGLETRINAGQIVCRFDEYISDYVDESDLEKAIDNITHEFRFISTLEDINLNLPKLAKVLDIKEGLSFPHEGKTVTRPKAPISSELHEMIAEMNEYDIRLYAKVKELQ